MPLHFRQYPDIIKKTAIFPKIVDDFSLAYFIIGFYDELSEYFEKIEGNASKEEIIKEVGDVCWYACGLCDQLGIDFIELLESPKVENKNINSLRLLGMVKKYYRDNKELSVDLVKETLLVILQKILEPFNIDEVLEINYNKLLTRLENNTVQGDGDNR